MTNSTSAAAVITAVMGRWAKIRTEPCDMMRVCRSALSAMSPSTSASTKGASG